VARWLLRCEPAGSGDGLRRACYKDLSAEYSGHTPSIAPAALGANPAISTTPSLHATPTATADALAPASLSSVIAAAIFMLFAPVHQSPALTNSLFLEFGGFVLSRRRV
jgi:hypothetical protein